MDNSNNKQVVDNTTNEKVITKVKQSEKIKKSKKKTKSSQERKTDRRFKKNCMDAWLREDNLKKLENWAKQGLSDFDIAKNMGIDRSTLYEWRKKSPTISNTLKQAKDVADQAVENALYKNAMSGNITAQIFWLKNRKISEWRDRVEVKSEATVNANVNNNPLSKLNEEDLVKIYKMASGTKGGSGTPSDDNSK